MNLFIHLGDITVELVAFVYVKIAIENGHRKFVSFPMKSMVDRSIVVCLPEGKQRKLLVIGERGVDILKR